MFRFYGTPLQAIKSKMTGKILFVFDTKGEYYTDDKSIYERAEGFFDCLEITVTETGKRKKKTFYNPPITIEKNEPKEEGTRHCKKCDFSCDFQADMLQHYREFHSKKVKEA
jgi:hypothetical protein